VLEVESLDEELGVKSLEDKSEDEEVESFDEESDVRSLEEKSEESSEDK
jgi:hypothetical protein